MSSFFVIGAEAGSNLVQNPSAEASGNNNPWSSTVTRDTTYARFGNYSYKIVGSAGSQGINLPLTSASTAASPHYVSFYARGHSGSLQVALTGPGSGFTAAAIIGGASGGWARYGASVATAAASGATAVVIRDITNETWYVDAVQVERQSYPTTYIDGSLDGLYSWAGQYHASTSYRDAQERRGGREYDLLTSFGVAVADSSTGLGAPPLQINTQSLALQPGTVAQSYKTLPAEIVIQSTLGGSTLAALHSARNALYGVIKPDAKRGYQPVMIGYSGANGTYKLWNEFYYASGLEQGALAGYYENPQIRLLAARPYWAADNQEQTALTVNAQVVNAYIAQRTAGSWAQMGGSGAQLFVRDLAVGPDGTVYAGGSFTSIGGAGSTAYIAKWNGASWSSMGGSGANSIVYSIAVGPDGMVYAGGSFTSIGGAGSTAFVAKWNGSAWSGMGGSGAQNELRALAVGPDGTVYAGGNFTSIGGAGSTARIAKWNGSAWSGMGGSGADSTVTSLAVGPDGTVYAGGNFTSIGGAGSTAYIAKWNGSAWSGMGGSGANNAVTAIAIGIDGTVYAGGFFTSIGGAGSTAYIAKWNGTSWSSMGGSGANSIVYDFSFDIDGNILAGGNFSSIGGASLADRFAIWNGSVWTQPDVDLSGSPVVYAIATAKDKIYIGFDTSGSSTVSAQTAVTNGGTAPAYPTLTVINSGSTANTLQWLENQSTDQQQYYSQSINAGETLTVSMAPLNKTVKSNWRGTVYGQPLPNSDFANWRLLPGANTISTFITGTTTASCAALLTWTPMFAGVDGGA